MFGHWADSHTVCNPRPRANFFKSWKLSPNGALAFSHSGFGFRGIEPSSIWINCEDVDMLLSILHRKTISRNVVLCCKLNSSLAFLLPRDTMVRCIAMPLTVQSRVVGDFAILCCSGRIVVGAEVDTLRQNIK